MTHHEGEAPTDEDLMDELRAHLLGAELSWRTLRLRMIRREQVREAVRAHRAKKQAANAGQGVAA